MPSSSNSRPRGAKQTVFYMLLVFGHLLAASMALGAIVATDLRLLTKLAQDRVRIAPPNEFVGRIVLVSLVLLYATGANIVALGLHSRPDYLENPKLLAKIFLVLLLTLNAFVLHRFTFPRLARGRPVAAWRLSDWLAVAVPVGISNSLWLFIAFLGIARPWNFTVSMREVLGMAATVYVVAQSGVLVILYVATRTVEGSRRFGLYRFKRWLGNVGTLGTAVGQSSQKPVPLHASSGRGASGDGTPLIAAQLASRSSNRKRRKAA